MLFNTTLFAIFLTAFLLVYTFFARTRVQKLWAIAVASCLFYAGWNPRYVPLLLGTALVDFFLARAMDRHPKGTPRRRALLTSSIVLNLGVLAYFKYTNFAIKAVYELSHLFGSTTPAPIFDIVLPVGISFYTFQSMSYTIDVYRGTLTARKGPLEFLAGVCFFPHLVAGPIIRASVLLPQFEKFAPLPWARHRRGVMLIFVGLFNKSIADLLAPVVETLYTTSHPTALTAWTGVLAFAGQLFGDFCGYTDIAIGVALLLDFELPANFNLPYLSSSPSDFWNRWHISLSTWFRDYVFMPLGKRDFVAHRKPRPYRNLFITILLAGLWHGAGWNYVAWGVYWGGLLSLNHYIFDKVPSLRKTIKAGPRRIAGIAVTFYCWLISGVLFRSPDLPTAGRVLRSMHLPRELGNLSPAALLTLVLVIAGLVLGHLISWLANERPSFQTSRFFWPTLVVLCSLALVFRSKSHAFIYFQF